jgi:pimeloyl-ACP methyl ester carboxylesterase
MDTVKSKDGTRIAYDRRGSGPPLLLVDGAFCSRAFGPMGKLAPLLAERYTVYWYDRRGRGDSGDAADYAVERELEDLAALVDVMGEAPGIYGSSSGAVLALRAAAAGIPARKLALFEPPLALDGTHRPDPLDYRERIAEHLFAGRRADAVKLFMKVVGVPAIGIFVMRLIPGVWSSLRAVAHTLPHDFAILGDTQSGGPMPDELVQRMASITAPTLMLAGGKSPAWMHHAADCVARGIGGATLRVVPGQDHNVAAKAIAPILTEFFAQG